MITLGIIGVVAALTMPALIASYQKMVLKQQFKKSYSLLTQSFNKVVADFDGSTPQCYYILNSNNSLTNNTLSGDCNAVRDILFKNLSIIKTCEDKSYDRGCIPKYKGFDTMSIENNPDLSEEDAKWEVRGQPGFFQNAILNTNASYVLADGTIILDYGDSRSFPQIFAVDINGKKGPNKWGYDVFSYWTGSNDKRGYYLFPTSYFVEKGGLTTVEMIKEVYK